MAIRYPGGGGGGGVYRSQGTIIIFFEVQSTMDQVWKRKYLNIFFHHRILGGENIFEYIFTTVFWGEKIYLNIFSPPYFVGRKYI